MIIHILTPTIPENFWKPLSKSKDHTLIFQSEKTLAQVVKLMTRDDFLYWEAPDNDGDLKKGLKLLIKQEDLLWGVLDPQAQVKDVAELFFQGACDYLGPPYFPETLGVTRFERMLQWCVGLEHPGEVPLSTQSFDWAQVVSGQEYPFLFLLVSLADTSKLKKRFGEKRYHQLLNDFRTWLGWTAQEEGGQLWMDMDTSFLVLFPDSLSTTALIYGFKTLLSRLHLGFEYFCLEQPLDLILAAHRGQCAWHPPGQTGNVVSDGVNSIFHLGQKFALENTLVITENCLPLVPESLKDLILPQGLFEGRQTYRFQKVQFTWTGGQN